MEILLLEDRQPISTINSKTADLLKRIGIVKKETVERVYFCGALITNTQALIFLPRNSRNSISKKKLNPQTLASTLLLALDKYKSSTSLHSGADVSDENPNGLDILSDILWLINDFVSNGLYRERSRSKSVNSGKINWKKTIIKEKSFPGENGAPIFFTYHSEITKLTEQSAVSFIHAEVLREIDSIFSWIVTGDSSVRISADIDHVPKLNEHLDHKKNCLLKALNMTYSDRETRLLTSLLNYLGNSSEGFTGEYLIGVSLFQGVWEEMLRTTIPNVKPVNHLLPKPVIYLRENCNAKQTKGMLTDIASFKDSQVSIIDAKYYSAEGANDSPGWPDIVKQLYYAKSIKAVMPNLEVSNWFIFPGKQENISNGPIKAVRIIDPIIGLALDELFPPIGCAYLCPLEVIENYIKNSKFSIAEVAPLYSLPSFV